MKSDFDFNLNVKKEYEEKRINFFNLLLEFFKSLFNVFFLFLLISPIFIIIFYFFKIDKIDSSSSLIDNLWKENIDYFKFIFNFIKRPFLIYDERENNLELKNIFLPAFFSLFLSGSIYSNISFSRGFSNGVEKYLKLISLKRKDEILERNFIEDKLIRILEDIQNKSVRLQYDFFEFSKKHEKLDNNSNYGEIDKILNSNFEVDQIKIKIENLESHLDKLNSNIFDLGMNMNRKNRNYYLNFPKRNLNNNKNSEIENKEEKKSEIK
ncbi:MAG: hypothetical protein AM1032_000195 [Mycoplasmataceae bacterium]|nr:MAG: hypothetical protein AM1032_000195 [Mycoplasmataceae bacterium]